MDINFHEQDCAVCLQKCHHPTQLPCGHVFCFLCVKLFNGMGQCFAEIHGTKNGVAIQNKKCAMCRADIPSDYLDHPVLLERLSPQHSTVENINEVYQWYYEGRNGWWKYDERSNDELETAFNASNVNCTLLLAGALYSIDFQNMMQVRRSDPTRRRRVRRDNTSLPAKGVAGIKNFDNGPVEQVKSNTPENSDEVIIISQSEDEVIVIDDDEEGEVATNENTDSNSSLDIIHVFSTINLVEPDSLQEYLTTEDT